MPTPREDLIALRKPSNIKNALLASSPYVLRKAFKADKRIQRLIAAGEKIISMISNEIQSKKHLDEITLSALAFIVEQVSVEYAPSVFGARFRRALANPDAFFVHFAAHAIRCALQMPVSPLHTAYSHEEMQETLKKMR